MSINFIPASLVKKITFRRLENKAVAGYEIYGKFNDNSYTSGYRTELIDYIENPNQPDLFIKRIPLDYSTDATWKIPNDAYVDREHQFRLFFDDAPLPTMFFKYNRVNGLITIDTVLKPYSQSNKIELEYYQDLITKTYMLEEQCDIWVKPIFIEGYNHSHHNIIL